MCEGGRMAGGGRRRRIEAKDTKRRWGRATDAAQGVRGVRSVSPMPRPAGLRGNCGAGNLSRILRQPGCAKPGGTRRRPERAQSSARTRAGGTQKNGRLRSSLETSTRGGGKEWGQAARERVGEREGGSGRSQHKAQPECRLSGSRRRRQAPWRTCSMCPWASRRHRRGDRSSGASWRLQPVWTGGQSPVPSCFRPC